MDTPEITPDVAFIGAVDAQTALFAAIAKASVAFEPVYKDTAGQHKAGQYKYAPLSNLVAATRKALGANGVIVLQTLSTPASIAPSHRLTTIVAGHGARIETTFDFAPAGEGIGDGVKEYGKQTTYFRRYAYNSIFMLDGEDDADADSQVTRAGTQNQRKAPEAPRASAPRQAVSQSTQQAPRQLDEATRNYNAAQPGTPEMQQRLRNEAAAASKANALPEGYEDVGAKQAAEAQRQKDVKSAESAAKVRELEAERLRSEAAAKETEELPPLDLEPEAPESEVITDVTPEQNQAIKELLVKLNYKGSAVGGLLAKHAKTTLDEIDSRSARLFIAGLQGECRDRGLPL